MGSIYLRGKTYWIAYRKNGKNIFESAKSDKKTVAEKLLVNREAAVNENRDIITKHVNFSYLKQLILDDYQVNGKRSSKRLKGSIAHLEKYFTGYKADHIGTSDIRAYIKTRLEKGTAKDTPDGASNATINRELACLRRMLHLAFQDGRVNKVPFFPMLKEAAPRQGFFENDEYIAILNALPAHLRPITTFAYRTGWRKNEILNLKWNQVSLKERLIYLTPDQTKNSEARSIYIGDELYQMLRVQKAKNLKKCEYVFHYEGKHIKDFRGSWDAACIEAGLKGKLFHDFRRTAARNLTRSGTQETVAMKITGHKTRSVFDRYNITSRDDIRAAIERQDSYLSNGITTIFTTVDKNQEKGISGGKAEVINFTR